MSESAFNIHQDPLDALEVRLRIKIICFISWGPRLDLRWRPHLDREQKDRCLVLVFPGVGS